MRQGCNTEGRAVAASSSQSQGSIWLEERAVPRHFSAGKYSYAFKVHHYGTSYKAYASAGIRQHERDMILAIHPFDSLSKTCTAENIRVPYSGVCSIHWHTSIWAAAHNFSQTCTHEQMLAVALNQKKCYMRGENESKSGGSGRCNKWHHRMCMCVCLTGACGWYWWLWSHVLLAYRKVWYFLQ